MNGAQEALRICGRNDGAIGCDIRAGVVGAGHHRANIDIGVAVSSGSILSVEVKVAHLSGSDSGCWNWKLDNRY